MIVSRARSGGQGRKEDVSLLTASHLEVELYEFIYTRKYTEIDQSALPAEGVAHA